MKGLSIKTVFWFSALPMNPFVDDLGIRRSVDGTVKAVYGEKEESKQGEGKIKKEIKAKDDQEGDERAKRKGKKRSEEQKKEAQGVEGLGKIDRKGVRKGLGKGIDIERERTVAKDTRRKQKQGVQKHGRIAKQGSHEAFAHGVGKEISGKAIKEGGNGRQKENIFAVFFDAAKEIVFEGKHFIIDQNPINPAKPRQREGKQQKTRETRKSKHQGKGLI